MVLPLLNVTVTVSVGFDGLAEDVMVTSSVRCEPLLYMEAYVLYTFTVYPVNSAVALLEPERVSVYIILIVYLSVVEFDAPAVVLLILVTVADAILST